MMTPPRPNPDKKSIAGVECVKRIGFTLIIALLCACAAPPPRLPPFYTPPNPLPAGQPGQIIRAESVDGPALKGVKLWRILYHSTAPSGEDIAVSGLIAQPAGPVPQDGFPVVVMAHGTSGIAQSCAPSIHVLTGTIIQPSFYVREIKPFLDAGFAVVMTDYQGMGAPGPYAYLIGASEGRTVLDSRRAIRDFAEVSVSTKTFIWGVSQGGHAAAFAGELAATYAPEWEITGIALEAPAAELIDLVNSMFATDQRSATTGLAMMIVGAWSRTYPNDALDNVLTAKGKRDLSAAYNKCLFAETIDYLIEPPDAYFKTNPATVPAWTAHLIANTPGQSPIHAPIFVAQGSADPIVLPATTTAFVQKMCSLGNVVQLKMYPGVQHLNISTPAQPDVLAWMAARLRAEPPPSTCNP